MIAGNNLIYCVIRQQGRDKQGMKQGMSLERP